MKTTRLHFPLAILFAAIVPSPAPADAAPAQPNIIFVPTEDLGDGDTATLSLEMRAGVPRLIRFALAGGDLLPTRSKVLAPLFVSTNRERRNAIFLKHQLDRNPNK